MGIDIIILIVGILLIYLISKYTPIGKWWEKFVKARIHNSEIFEEASYQDLLHLNDDFGIIRIYVSPDSKMIGQSLLDSFTPYEQFSILGIERGKDWLALPKAREVIKRSDVLVVYGALDQLREVFNQP